MRYVWISTFSYLLLWLQTSDARFSSHSEDEIMSTSDNDGHFGHLHSNGESAVDRILCLFKGNSKKGKGKHQNKGNNAQQQQQPQQNYGPFNTNQQQQQQYGPPPQQNLAQQNYGPPPQQNLQNYGLPPQQNLAQMYGPPNNNQQQQYGPPPQQNLPLVQPQQSYGVPNLQLQQNYGPQQNDGTKSYSFNFAFGDRTRPRQKGFPMIFGPVPPPQTNFNFNPQPMSFNNNQPAQQNYQPTPQTNFAQQLQTAAPYFNFQQETPQPQAPVPQQNYGTVLPLPLPPVQNNFIPQQNYYSQSQQTQNQGYNNFPQQDYNSQQLPLTNALPETESIDPFSDSVKDHRSVYVYGPPPNAFGDLDPTPAPQKVTTPQKPNTHYQVVFIRAPTPPPPQQMELQLPLPPEMKTMVYVMVKKPEKQPEIKFTRPKPFKPSPPEVFFIKYKNGKQNNGLPSTSDADKYISSPNSDDFMTEQIAEKVLAQQQQHSSGGERENNIFGGGYEGSRFSRSRRLPSTSSELAMEMAGSETDFPSYSKSHTMGSTSHYTAPGSRPWN